jgi:hypothetical protein
MVSSCSYYTQFDQQAKPTGVFPTTHDPTASARPSFTNRLKIVCGTGRRPAWGQQDEAPVGPQERPSKPKHLSRDSGEHAPLRLTILKSSHPPQVASAR